MTEEIIEENKLIAEFMGAVEQEFLGKNRFFFYKNSRIENLAYLPSELKFHSSWDWLMPVAEKITNELNYSVELNSLGTNNWRFAVYSGGSLVCQSRLLETPIEAIYTAVIEFIKWYNLKKKS